LINSRAALQNALENYKASDSNEGNFIRQFLSLLQHPNAYKRDHLPGHLTGSAWIIDNSRQFVLLTHHAKLNRWLQPGGHADGDEDITAVALREATEETGVTNFKLLSENIFDIDIHPIPARTNFPEHLHFDVRILLEADRSRPLFITEESHDLAWIKLEDVGEKSGKNESMQRMVQKVKSLKSITTFK
jgi:8-oxo-dGTP pyrophosphatase MutT (NUDIX family)